MGRCGPWVDDDFLVDCPLAACCRCDVPIKDHVPPLDFTWSYNAKADPRTGIGGSVKLATGPSFLPRANLAKQSLRLKMKARDGSVQYPGVFQKTVMPFPTNNLIPPAKNMIPLRVVGHGSEQFSFKLITHNLLSPALPRQGYSSHGQRFGILLRNLPIMNADIICFEEVHGVLFKELVAPHLPEYTLGYCMKKPTDAKTDGVCVGFRKSKFILDGHSVELNFPKEASVTCLKNMMEPKLSVALLLRLRFRADQHKVLHVACAHLSAWDRLIPLCARTYELVHLMRKLNAFRAGASGGLILCGDLNLTPQSYLYSYITEGEMKIPKGVSYCLQVHPYFRQRYIRSPIAKMLSAYAEVLKINTAGNLDLMALQSRMNLVSCEVDSTHDKSKTFDYIFFDDIMLDCIGLLQLHSSQTGRFFVSDHEELGADFLQRLNTKSKNRLNTKSKNRLNTKSKNR